MSKEPYQQRMAGVYFTDSRSGQLYCPTVADFMALAGDLHLSDGPADASTFDDRVPSDALQQLAAKGKGTHFENYMMNVNLHTRKGMQRPGDRLVRHVHVGTGTVEFGVQGIDMRLISPLTNGIAALILDLDNQALTPYVPEDERPEYWGDTPPFVPTAPEPATREVPTDRLRFWAALPREVKEELNHAHFLETGLLRLMDGQSVGEPYLRLRMGYEAFEALLEQVNA